MKAHIVLIAILVLIILICIWIIYVYVTWLYLCPVPPQPIEGICLRCPEMFVPLAGASIILALVGIFTAIRLKHQKK